VPMAIQERAVCDNPDAGPDGAGFRVDGLAYTLEARTVPQAVTQPYNLIGTAQNGKNAAYPSDISGCLQQKGLAATGNEAGTLIRQLMAVRRFTPRECERLQGFPDDYTLVPFRGRPAANGNRYKALGNSMAVPVMRWIGERIMFVQALI
jgi:DNA (cytosine-5)-methyltransferase 1